MQTHLDILMGGKTSLAVAELTSAISSELRDLGCLPRVVRDAVPRPTGESAMLVVAPHEAYSGIADVDTDWLVASLRRSTLLVLAHPSSAEWEATLPYAEHAGALLHVSDAGIAAFKRMGRRARRFPLGYHPSFDRWHGAENERPIDVAFVGVLTPRRERLLAEAASALARHTTAIYVPDRPAAVDERLVDFVAGDDKLALLARSRTLLDLQRDEEPAFTWLRAVQAICNGCVLVSEGANDCPPLQPELHFVHAGPSHPHLALEQLLTEPDRLARLRREAYRFLRDELPLRRSVESLLELVEELPRAATRRRSSEPAQEHSLTLRPPVALEPQTPVEGSEADRLERVLESVTKQNAVLKKLFLDLRLLRRQVAQVAHALEQPRRPLTETSRTPAAESGQAIDLDVSVIVTVHNYGHFVREALESALASDGVSVELVVIDDASSDTSAAIVRSFMEEHPDAAITLVEQHINTGVQRARNLGFSLARAPLAFVLDADNLVYPSGIAKLKRALDQDPAAGYAYGLIERFSEHRSLGLMNTHQWDAGRLAEEHFIDAMALIRVEGWQNVGGYVTEQSLELGWEDYDLWLSFAMAGMHGVYARDFVGRYRVHSVSSLTMTTLDTSTLQARLEERHAAFFVEARRLRNEAES